MFNCHFRTGLANMFAGLLIAAALALMPQSLAFGQVEPSGQEAEKTALEVTKLRQEIAQLKKPVEKRGLDWAWWLGVAGGLLTGSVSTWGALRQRQGATDHPVHEKRLAAYPELVKITAPLAIYFPDSGGRDHVTLGPTKCAEIGLSLSKWYFDGGGLLMSTEARDAYFRLTRALTHASKSKTLYAPVFPDDSEQVSAEALDGYRSLLFKEIEQDLDKADPKKRVLKRVTEWLVLNLTLQVRKGARLQQLQARELASSKSVEAWKFGDMAGADPEKAAEPYQRFRDYVFLQNLSSKLRTALAADIRGRRRPD